MTFEEWTDRAGGGHLSTALRRLRDPSWHLDTEGAGAVGFPTPQQAQQGGDGDGQKEEEEGYQQRGLVHLGFPDHFPEEEHTRKGTQVDLCCLNC